MRITGMETEMPPHSSATRRHSASVRAEVYERYSTELKKRFKWLRPSLFITDAGTDLLQ